MDDMNDSSSWAQASKYYDQLWPIVDLKDSWSWGQDSRCYEQLKVGVEMND